MSTVLTTNVQAASQSNTQEAKLNLPKGIVQSVKLIAVLAVASGLFLLNVWAGLAFILAIGAFLSRDFFDIATQAFQSDFDLTKDVFSGLEPF